MHFGVKQHEENLHMRNMETYWETGVRQTNKILRNFAMSMFIPAFKNNESIVTKITLSS